ncbi:MAG TPA: hypothetical protein PKY72_03445 [Bacilli bacterium]|nr:hypothetical protein [Bacilli bacterium]
MTVREILEKLEAFRNRAEERKDYYNWVYADEWISFFEYEYGEYDLDTEFELGVSEEDYAMVHGSVYTDALLDFIVDLL